MERVGIYGMSFGGATAMLVCLNEPRCKAAANLDGSPFGDAAFKVQSLRVPSMFFYSQDAYGDSDDIYAAVENRAYRVYIRGSEHTSYTEVGYWSPLAKYAASYLPFGLGEVAPDRMAEIVNSYLVAFFNRHLKGEEGGLLDGDGGFGEVEFEER
jgi:dienelactone hydrolase